MRRTTSGDVAIFEFTLVLHSITLSENTDTVKISILELTFVPM